MEKKVGEEFEYNHKTFKTEIGFCNECAFHENMKCEKIIKVRGKCSGAERNDKNSIKFTEIENKKDYERKSFQVPVPEGWKIDKEKSTLENIVYKRKTRLIEKWEDLIGKEKPKTQVWVETYTSFICRAIEDIGKTVIKDSSRFEFIDRKHAKSALAMAQISQLMPFYGGVITDKEWKNPNIGKYAIDRYGEKLCKDKLKTRFEFLAFHTIEQRDSFLKCNERLIKDYKMME